MIVTLPVLLLVLYGGIVWVVVKKFRQTHNFGFLILGCGVLVWPLAVNFLRLDILWLHPSVSDLPNFFPFTLVTNGRVTPGVIFLILTYASKLVQASLILTGILVLGRSINETPPHAAGH